MWAIGVGFCAPKGSKQLLAIIDHLAYCSLFVEGMANASLGAAAVADPPQSPSAQDLRVALDIFLQGKDLGKGHPEVGLT